MEDQIITIDECKNLAVTALKLASKVYPYQIVTLTAKIDGCNPLIYVSDSFTWLTGYTEEECLGRDCRFLQGKHTSRITTTLIKENIQKEVMTDVLIVNYRKDGTSFINGLKIIPLFDEGIVKFFVGIQGAISISSEYNLVSEWNNAEVCEFLEKYNIPVGRFIDNAITGNKLLELTRRELQEELGLTSKNCDDLQYNLFVEVKYRCAKNREFHLGCTN